MVHFDAVLTEGLLDEGPDTAGMTGLIAQQAHSHCGWFIIEVFRRGDDGVTPADDIEREVHLSPMLISNAELAALPPVAKLRNLAWDAWAALDHDAHERLVGDLWRALTQFEAGDA